jgi:cytoskeleton protein RodZ
MSEGIGARLRSAREHSRLTIVQAAERLHVDAEVLEALEAENFAALGAPVYVRGHLRHYAELVGESAEALVDLYSQGARVPQPDLTRIPKPVPDHAGSLVVAAVLVVVVFSAAGAVWWGLSLSRRQWSTAVVRPDADASMLGGAASAGALVAVAASSPARPAPSSVVAPAALAAPPGAAAPVPTRQIHVVLAYSTDSWTEVYDATGRRLLYGLASAAATRALEGVPPLEVVLGDASGVTLAVGGQARSISRFVRSDHTARFSIAADGRVLAAPRKKGG